MAISSSSSVNAAADLLFRQIQIAERDSAGHHWHTEETVHGRMIRGKADRPRITGEVVESERSCVVDQDSQNPTTTRPVADRLLRSLVQPVGDEPLQLPTGSVDHSEGRVAGAGQLGSDADERLQNSVEGQLRRNCDPSFDERASSVVAVHAWIQHACGASVRDLQADFPGCRPFRSHRRRRAAATVSS